MPTFEPVDHDPWADDAPAAAGPLRFTVRPRRDDDDPGVPGVADPGMGDDPFARAAMRQREAVMPSGGRQEGPATDLIPLVGGMTPVGMGINAAASAAAGDYGDAAASAAGAVIPGMRLVGPAVRRAIAGVGAAGIAGAGLLAPSNTPAEADATHFSMVPDENERKGLDEQYNRPVYLKNAAGQLIRDQRGNPRVDKAATDAMQRDLLANATKEQAARAAADANRRNTAQAEAEAAKLKAGQASDRLKAFMDVNADRIDDYKKNNPGRFAEFNAASGASPDQTILMKSQVLQKHALEDQAEATRKAKEDLPFVQRYPEWAMPIEGGAIALGALGPGAVAFSRASKLRALAKSGGEALHAGSDVGRMQTANQLREALKLSKTDVAELLAAPLLPWGANTAIPAAIDAFRFNRDFDKPALRDDMKNLNPFELNAWKNLGTNVGEGLTSTVAGLLGANFAGALSGRTFKGAMGDARGALKSLDDYKALQAAGGSPHQAALAAAQSEAARHAGVAAQLQQQLDEIAANRAAAAAKGQKTRLKNQKAAEAEAKTAANEPPRETELLPRANALRDNALKRGKRKPKGALVAPGSSTGALQIPDM